MTSLWIVTETASHARYEATIAGGDSLLGREGAIARPVERLDAQVGLQLGVAEMADKCDKGTSRTSRRPACGLARRACRAA
jgi:hypothetical protein